MDFSKIIVPKPKSSFDVSKITLTQPKSSFDVSKISLSKGESPTINHIPTKLTPTQIAVVRGKAMEDFYTKQYTNFMNELTSAVKWYNTKNYKNPNANSVDFVLKYPDFASQVLGEYRFSQLPFYKRWGLDISGYYNLAKQSIQNLPETWKKDPMKVISDTAGIVALALGAIGLGKAIATTIQIWKYPAPGLQEAVNNVQDAYNKTTVNAPKVIPNNLDKAVGQTLETLKAQMGEGITKEQYSEITKFINSAIYLKNYQQATNATGTWGLTLRDFFVKNPQLLNDIVSEGTSLVKILPADVAENLINSINLVKESGNMAMNNLYPKPVTPTTIFSGINLPALGNEQVIKGLIELSKTIVGNPQITKELNKSLIETKLNEIQNYAYEYADSKDPGYQMADRPSETAGYKYELEKFKELGGQTLNEIYDLYRRNLDIPNELKQRATKILNTEIPKIEPKVPENLQSIANEPESIHSKKVEQIAKDAVEKVKQSENEEEALDALNQMENEFIKMLKVAKDNTERNDLYFDMEIALKQLPREYTTIGKNILKGFDNIRHTYNLLHTEDERQKQEKIQPQQVLTTPEVPAPKTDKELISNSDLKLMERFEVPSKARNIKELKRLTELEKLGYVEQIEPGYFKETKLNSLKDNLQPPETFKPPLAPKPIDIYKKRYIQLSDEDFKGVSNGSIFEFQNPIKEEELPFVATKEIKTTGVKNTFSGYFVDNADPVIEKIAEGIGRYSGAQFSVYKSASGQIVALDRDYLQYFKKRYGNFEMYVGKDATNSPVVIKQDDKNIGLIMPIELDKDKLIPEIPSGKYLTPLGEKLGIKPQVPPAETQVFTVPQAEQTTTPSTQTIPTNVQVPEKSIGIYKGQEYPLPKGFVLKKPNLQYDGGLGRYLWMPEKNDFIYYPSLKKIYKYLEWQDKAPNGMVGLDGFAKLQDIKTKKVGWVNNIKAREGIPLKEFSTIEIPKGKEKADITRILNKAKAELKIFETMIKNGKAVEESPAHIKILREIEYQQARLEGLSGEEALARTYKKFPEVKPPEELSKEVATNIKPEQVIKITEKPKDIGMGGVNPIEKVINALKEAKPIRAEQERIYREERAKRMAQAKAVGEKVTGEAGYYAELAQLKGEILKVQFESIRSKITQEDINALFILIKDSPSLRDWEKITARYGLAKLFGEFGGTVPTEGELKLLKKVFPTEFIKTVLDTKPLFDKFKNAGYEIINIPRALMASFDFSAPFRQGIFLMPSHPKEFAYAFGNMFRYAFREKNINTLMDIITKDPDFPLAMEYGLALTDINGTLTDREEAYMSSWAEKIPLIGLGIRASDRAYSGFLNYQRFYTWKSILNNFEKAGLNPRDNPKTLNDLSSFVNSGTGRGDLPDFLKSAQPLLNGLLFSPRLVSSRAHLLNPVWYAKLSAPVRKEALKSLLAFIVFGITTLSLAKMAFKDRIKVGLDWRSADFGKIIIGNTRIDIWGGFQQYVRLIGQLTTGQYISTTTGVPVTLGEGYKPLTRFDILLRFFEYKEAPFASLISDLLKGETAIGEPLTWKKEILNRITPMVFQDFIDLAKDNPDLLALGIFGIFGIGLQTYSLTYTEREQIYADKLIKQGIPKDQIKKLIIKERLRKQIVTQIGITRNNKDLTDQKKLDKIKKLEDLYETLVKSLEN